MKKPFILILLIAALVSCQDSKKEQSETPINNTEKIQPKDELGSSAQDQPIGENSDLKYSDEDTADDTSENRASVISGLYQNKSHTDDVNCDCYCVNIKTNGTSELCLKEDELYIMARFQRQANNINVFYSGKSPGTTNKDIPWDKFETGTPIAVLSPESDGSLKLDWKGFSIDGKIAVDYALYGKKTLEGTYKKK
ncbi:hypothetical protein [Christiangramia aestuarii]|uniref:Lipoprotein n=1 Tax=Christiangramia aestuarii TaxID=1028746 RepID=A0A7M3SY68_9FLAO|nr:hypothetical protein [Christiangramia aestuarii]MUP41549.1 hypothetical protein [Christiangramia aestuarii]